MQPIYVAGEPIQDNQGGTTVPPPTLSEEKIIVLDRNVDPVLDQLINH